MATSYPATLPQFKSGEVNYVMGTPVQQVPRGPARHRGFTVFGCHPDQPDAPEHVVMRCRPEDRLALGDFTGVSAIELEGGSGETKLFTRQAFGEPLKEGQSDDTPMSFILKEVKTLTGTKIGNYSIGRQTCHCNHWCGPHHTHNPSGAYYEYVAVTRDGEVVAIRFGSTKCLQEVKQLKNGIPMQNQWGLFYLHGAGAYTNEDMPGVTTMIVFSTIQPRGDVDNRRKRPRSSTRCGRFGGFTFNNKQYHPVSQLAQGATACVYSVVDPDDPVGGAHTVKAFKRGYVPEQRTLHKQAVFEAKLLECMTDKLCVATSEMDPACILMPALSEIPAAISVDLFGHVFAHGPLPPPAAKQLADDIHAAMDKLHRGMAVCHLDIKAENVMACYNKPMGELQNTDPARTADWHFVLIDPGCATRTGKMLPNNIGSEKYLPPEAILRQGDDAAEQECAAFGITQCKKVEQSFDYWCFGVLLLFAMTSGFFWDRADHRDSRFLAFLNNSEKKETLRKFSKANGQAIPEGLLFGCLQINWQKRYLEDIKLNAAAAAEDALSLGATEAAANKAM